MPRVTGFPTIASMDVYTDSSTVSTQGSILGQVFACDDGRMFRYVKNGGVAMVKGNLQQAPANDNNFKDMAVQAAVAVNATTIPVTLGGSAVTANQFVGGMLIISVTPGIGQAFTILSHDVQATTNGTCNFQVLEAVQTALTTSSKATVQLSPWNGIIVQPTASTGIAVGGAVHAIPLSSYGFIQTYGPGCALSDATVSAATTFALSPSVTTAGCVTKAVSLQQVVGWSMVMVNVSAENEPVFWSIE